MSKERKRKKSEIYGKSNWFLS